MLTDLRLHHRGDVGYFALFSPFVGTYKVPAPGMTKGVYMDDDQPFVLDIRLWKRLGLIQAPIVCVNGRIGSGKTSLVTKAALDEQILSQGEGNQFRLFMQIIRSNDGVLENQELIEALGAKAIDMSKQSVNLYDQEMGLSDFEQLEQLVDAMEYVEGAPPSTERVMVTLAALKVFLAKCEEDPVFKANACDALFFGCLSRLTEKQYNDALADADRFMQQIQKKLNALKTDDPGERELMSEALTRLVEAGVQPEDIVTNLYELRDLKNKCLRTLRRLGGADFGHTFSGQGSLADLMSQPVVAFDLTKLNERTIGFLQQVFWRYKTSAINRGDKRFLYSMEIHDENHRLWRYPAYARNMANYMKIIRSTDTVLWLVTHRPGDYNALPQETRDTAMNAMNEAEIFFWGAQGETVAKESQAAFKFSHTALEWLIDNQQGEFVVKIGNQPETRVFIILVEAEQRITDTEQASRSRLQLDPGMEVLID